MKESNTQQFNIEEPINIVFFGASVTAQKGYVHFFKELCKNNDLNIIQLGYGSMHIKDAGIIYLDTVIDKKPRFCFIDWFSTGYIINEPTFLDTIVYKLIENDCVPVFLFMERLDVEKRTDMYNYCKDYANNYSIPYIDLFNKVEDKTSILRDVVHTNDKGSILYADIIYNEFIYKILNYNILQLKSPPKNKYYTIKKIDINKHIYERISLEGNGEIIGLSHNTGPYNGIVKLITKNGCTNLQIWDQWCYYNRKSICLSKICIDDFLIIEITNNNNFSKENAKVQLDWESYTKMLDALTLYYIGEVQIKEMS